MPLLIDILSVAPLLYNCTVVLVKDTPAVFSSIPLTCCIIVVVVLIFLIFVAIVWKVAVLEVLTPLSVIALAMSDFPSLTEDFKLSTSVC